MKQILLINDLAGYGKVATAAMLPVLSYMGLPVYNLPTALVSNTLDYGKFNILETTDYMEGVFPVWKELGFSFDAIATGFICSERQARMVADYCREQSDAGTIIFVDPIMGDEGKLYNGVTPERVQCMREMLEVAHLCFPNYTEAAYLTDTPYNPDGVTMVEAKELLRKLVEIGTRSALITSIKVDGQTSVVGFQKCTFSIPIALNFGTTSAFHFVSSSGFFRNVPTSVHSLTAFRRSARASFPLLYLSIFYPK